MAATFLSAGARSYVISSGLPLGDEDVQINANINTWESGAQEFEDTDAPGGKKIILTTGGWGGWAAMFWETAEGVDLTPALATDATLEFYVKATDNCNVTVAFTKVGATDSETVSAETLLNFNFDDLWHKVSLNIHDCFPAVANAIEAGDKVRVPFFTITGQPVGHQLQIADVRIVEGGEVRHPEFGAVSYGTSEAIARYADKDYVVHVDYALTANADGTLTADVDCRGFENIVGLVRRIHFANQDYSDLILSDGVYSATSTATYELGETLSDFFIYLPYANGDLRVDIKNYVYGMPCGHPAKSENAYLLNAALTQGDNNSATITYDLFKAEAASEDDYALYVNGEAMGVANGMLVLDNLSEDSDLVFNLYAELDKDGHIYRTPSATVMVERPKKYYMIIDGTAPNAYLPGETAADRRAIPLSLDITITYELDHTLTADMTVHGTAPAELAPRFTFSGFDQQLMTKIDDNHFTVNTGSTNKTYTYGEGIAWLYVKLDYSGGSSGETNFAFQRGGTAIYKVGDTNARVEYGPAVEIVLDMPKTEFHSGESVILKPYGKDANGHYLLDPSSFEFDVESDAFSFDGNKLTADSRSDGYVDVVVRSGESEVRKSVRCITSAAAFNLLDQTLLEEYTFDMCEHTSNHHLAFDGIDNTDNSCLVWNCGSGDEHHIEIDFGSNRNIELIEIHWDGAGPMAYSIILTPDTPTAESMFRAAPEGQVFNESVTNGGGAYKGWHQFVTDGADGATARTMRIETSKAYNSGWGIKITELRAYGTHPIVSGITGTEIDNEEAAHEYYNLQGVRVANPTSGLYIRRQGTKAEKVMLR